MTVTASTNERRKGAAALVILALLAFLAGCQSTSSQSAATPTVAGQTCYGCHLHEYQNSSKPPHKVLQFGLKCGTCHSNTAWQPATGFDHQEIWPLTGKHVGPACAQCHGDFSVTLDSACVSCHLKDYEGAQQPNHVQQNTPKTCQNCHSTLAWKPAVGIDHDLFYPLTGKHKGLACDACHKTPGDQPPKVCSGCHQGNYDATSKPTHKNVGFSSDCAQCHNTFAWQPAPGFDHDLAYPLTGKHLTTACENCHSDPWMKPAKVCASCHLQQYQATTSPNHATVGFPQTCETCHSTSAWQPATNVDHDKFFPLTGKHKTAACGGCHQTPGDKPTKVCSGCHLPAYQGTTNPNHSKVGFPTTCESCHSTTGWQPASGFDHNQYYPLTNKHATAPCESCHTSPGVKPSKVCSGCHQPDYNAATNPNHKSLGLPTTCQTCHTTAGWSPAGYPAHQFPITSGKHKLTCNKCHTNPANFAAFSCISGGCHTASKTNSKHAGEVSGYVYSSAACVKCHPDGKE
ncbi:MAG: cytochrome c3 family protein [Deltaproteobacteria bacterium]|nr:cytochrome c3 family protein [Deltaproteobacteria bacterium]